MQKALGVHESLELHELLTFKNVCLTKSSTMMGLVNCEELRGLMQQDVQATKQSIQQIQNLMQRQ
ncbi:hypothetical protein [Halalkalibacterium halodurans]|uniref:Spore coat protein n=1 Tax=Halalkalibacterium halodurans (strain ATCC BAA-125 / DSM 18197 / FERM 7344 / JCM 9153 / C-125) TaxID=272558 RepID=Q9KEV7_HALH5|nr:spore coat protein [Halalkalibacterium halodurans C-125]